MNRRALISLLGNGIIALPLTAHAQPNTPTIGYFSGRSAETEGIYKDAFHLGLAEFGFREHRNVAIEYRFAEGQYSRLPSLAADLVRQKVAVLSQQIRLPDWLQSGNHDHSDFVLVG